ncbi:MAG: plastocyanin/azurin family copper-binding protein [Balneolaceae bacterium]
MMIPRKPLSIVFYLLAFTLCISFFACSNNTSGTDNEDDNQDPSEVRVEMLSVSFSPKNIEIEVGTTVRWVNVSSVGHTVTSGTDGEHDGKFDSGNVPPDQSFSFEFNEAGIYDYYCIPHLNNGMVGKVTVVEGSDD